MPSLDTWAKTLEVKPLSARSLILSILLGTHPPSMSAASLIRIGRVLDIEAGTVRTALSRMLAAGDVTTADGRYYLSDRLITRQRQQDLGLADVDTEWDGTWWTVIAEADRRPGAERRAFRAAMTGARLGELRPDIWMRPANTGLDLGHFDGDIIVSRGTLQPGTTSGVELVARLWDVADLERRATTLLRAIEVVAQELESDTLEAIAPSFLISTAVVQFLRQEPLLPDAISSAPQGAELRVRYREVNKLFRSRLAEA